MTSRAISLKERTLRWGLFGVVIAGVGCIAWWFAVYSVIVDRGYMSSLAAIQCLGKDSFACTLAMSLCGENHPIGVTWYDPRLLQASFLAGLLLAGFWFLLPSRERA